jgi:hypothetical protein
LPDDAARRAGAADRSAGLGLAPFLTHRPLARRLKP